MSSEFNPYREWLSIPLSELPANYYRLLGLVLFESDINVIDRAADRQMSYIRTFQTGKYSELSQQLLNELSQARITLLDQEKKAEYDVMLRAQMHVASEPSVIVSPPPVPPPIVPSEPSPVSLNRFNANDSALQNARQNLFSEFPQKHDHTKKSGHGKTHIEKGKTTTNKISSSKSDLTASQFITIISSVFIGAFVLLLFYILIFKIHKPVQSYSNNQNDVISTDHNDVISAPQTNDIPTSQVDETPKPLISESYKSNVPAKRRIKKHTVVRHAGESMIKTVNGADFVFRWCPAGVFMMGSPESEDGRSENETLHEVTLTKGFWIMETELTQKQWEAIMGNNPSNFKGANLPVENVSWDDCQAFCKKCSQSGLSVQLPTESQWEYACRAGSNSAYSGFLDNMGWYESNSNDSTHPVGKKNSNAWGLYDMHGNVWEWCADWFGDYPQQSVTNPEGPSVGSVKVFRGGGWFSSAERCRSADRDCSPCRYRNRYLGFRVVVNETDDESVSDADDSKAPKDNAPDSAPVIIEYSEDF